MNFFRTPLYNKGMTFAWHITYYQALLNRKKVIKNYLKTHKVRKLNLGCWPFTFKGWLNTDLYGNEILVPLDITQTFPLPNNSFDYIFCEHTIEHFSLQQALHIFSECLRVLKPGGKIRFATPNLPFLIGLYSKKKTQIQKEYIEWSSGEFIKELGLASDAMVINNFVRAWGHQFIYDFNTLKYITQKCGFEKVEQYKPGQSKDKHLKNLESHWKAIGRKDFNDLETLVIEATKPKKSKT